MSFLEYFGIDGKRALVGGSDKRMNTSARVDGREFYVSRDSGQFYTLYIEDDDAAAGDIVANIMNTSKNEFVFIRRIKMSSENAATFKVAYGDATAATGTPVTPVNMNRTKTFSADVTAFGNGAVGGVTADTFFASERCPANTSVIYKPLDGLILGQNDNIVVEYDTGTTGDIEIEILFYLDTLE